MLILRNKGFHEFVFTILPRSLFNTLMDLLYSGFVSKLFISNDSLILRLCILDNFANVFGYSQLNCPWYSLECSVASTLPIFLPCYLLCVQLIEWARVFFFLWYIPPHNHNLIRKHRGSCVAIVYFYYCMVYFSVLQLM